ncbi:XAP5-domain-containing protein [Choiromyces venosus 120613-1]|uniref:XAP5-domain-containing protein n=1 Tax=Choiromyces venosus 120613-1 TaxID=1336337 RepID=A0A3N4J746_9PEZI|nr:XAP5-domain-containing protein [Choiromyces venosus 120613-1]
MSDPSTSTTTPPSRFVANTETLEDALKTQTVGLVHLSEFKKRRVELAEQRDREAAEKLQPIRNNGAANSSREGSETPTAGGSGTGGSGTGGAGGGVAGKRGKKRRKVVKGKLSFAGEDDGDDVATATDDGDGGDSSSAAPTRAGSEDNNNKSGGEEDEGKKRKVNPKLGLPPPKVLTKNTLLREAQERETLRREFLALQEKIKNEEINIPFVFYDGTNVAPPTGEGVTVKKGEAVWLFLERARRMSGRREWLRVSVDDLLLVRGEVIIPHHFEFYYFIVNRTMGPNGLLFDFPSSTSPAPQPCTVNPNRDDPTMTKVVDRRWYERNKHIFPASVWTEFDPNMDYSNMVRRDMGGNAFFFG